MWKRPTIVLLSLLCLMVLFLYPLLSHITTHTTSLADGALIIWLINQSATAWIGAGDWYNWPFFYPYTATATYSDPFVTAGLFLLPIRAFTENVVLQHNVLLITSGLGNFFAMFLLAKKIWKDSFAALVSGTAFAFSYLAYQFIPHLHTYMVFGLPLGLWALSRYFETQRRYFGLLFGVFFTLQALNAPMTGYFFIAISLLYVIREGKLKKLVADPFLGGVIAVSFAVCVWYYLPYLVTAQIFAAVRTIRDTAHFSYPIEKLFSAEILLPLIMIALSWIKVRQKKVAKTVLSLHTIVLFIILGASFMLGPVVKIGSETVKIFDLPIPLPYAGIYYSVPGIQAFRAVSRWAVVLNFGIALGLGWTVAHSYLLWPKSCAQQIVLSGFALYLLTNFWLTTRTQYLYQMPVTVPEIYTLVKESDKKVLAEFPMYQWSMGKLAGHENQRLIYQLYHGKNLYNGVSGITPPQRSTEIAYHLDHFPDQNSITLLRRAGVELVLIHFDEFQEIHTTSPSITTLTNKSEIELRKLIQESSDLLLLHCTDVPNDCLYKLN